MKKVLALLTILTLVSTSSVLASSHREADNILKHPQLDATDFYMFRSYEPGREDFITVIANYQPLQDPYGGPNYFPMATKITPDKKEGAIYGIHFDTNGDAREDVTITVEFTDINQKLTLPIGGEDVAVPVKNLGSITSLDDPDLNNRQEYEVNVLFGSVIPQKLGVHASGLGGDLQFVYPVSNADTGETVFKKAVDNIGTKSIPDYSVIEKAATYNIEVPGLNCSEGSRMFVGQRKESFAVNLGETFDLLNIQNVTDPTKIEASSTEFKNVTSLIFEIPIACLTSPDNPVIAGWTTSHLVTIDDQSEGEGISIESTQISRLANPLVNEVAIGYEDKDLFNASHPSDDGQFATYVTNPTLPLIIQLLHGVTAPTNFPRNDLVAVFLTGLPGVNDDGSVAEMMRLNTSIPPTPKDAQNNLGVAAGDNAGYPNGRRPGDDTVDISLRAVMGLLCHLGLGLCAPADAPDGLITYTDGAVQNADQFDNAFPYLKSPIPGSPNQTP